MTQVFLVRNCVVCQLTSFLLFLMDVSKEYKLSFNHRSCNRPSFCTGLPWNSYYPAFHVAEYFQSSHYHSLWSNHCVRSLIITRLGFNILNPALQAKKILLSCTHMHPSQTLIGFQPQVWFSSIRHPHESWRLCYNTILEENGCIC